MLHRPWFAVALLLGISTSFAVAAEQPADKAANGAKPPAGADAKSSAGSADRPLNQPPEGFVALFNGRDLTGWRGGKTESPKKRLEMSPEDRARHDAATVEDIHKHWTVEDGELVNDGTGLYLTTDKDYGDFELWVDYKTVPKADSGIYLRGIPQVQIWDYTKEGGKWDRNADKGSGGLFNNPKGSPGQLPLVLADKPFGEWNHFKITMIGDNVTVYLNDKLVVDNAPLHNYYEKGEPPFSEGPIQLQTHGGEIRWRNIFLREIPRNEAANAAAE